MFEFLKGFEKVTVTQMQRAQLGFSVGELKYYCQDEHNQLTHLLVRNSKSNEVLNELLTSLSDLSKPIDTNHLKFLALINCQLEQFPPQILAFTTLTTLNLCNNQLSALPEGFAKLNQLQRLDLRENQLSALPAEFTKLSQLYVLILTTNQLSALPEDFSKLNQLHQLYLSINQLSALPADFPKLNHLQQLYNHLRI